MHKCIFDTRLRTFVRSSIVFKNLSLSKRLALLLACGLFVFRVGAQLPGIAFSRYTSEQGLPNDNISSLAQDRDGYLWVGTADGVACFDGRRFVVFRHSDSLASSIPGNIITGLGRDAHGRVWVSTDEGVCWYDGPNRAFRQVALHVLDGTAPFRGYISGLVTDHEGYGWFATGNCLIRIDVQTFETRYFPFPNGWDGVSRMFEDSRHRMWVSLGGRATEFDRNTGEFKFYFGRGLGPSSEMLGEDPQGRIWMSSWGRGFYLFDEKKGQFDDFPDSAGTATVFLFDDLPQYGPSVWAGCGVHGVYILTLRDTVAHQFPQQPLEPYSHNGTRTMAILRDSATGIVWLGTETGLEKYDPSDLKCSRTILPDAEKMGQFISFSEIVRMPEDPDLYWISVWGQGMYQWRRSTNQFRHFGTETGLHDNDPFDFVLTRRGTIWLAQQAGIEEIDARTGRSIRVLGKTFLRTPGISHKILSVEEDDDGSIWIGANYEGLFKLNPYNGQVQKIELPGVSDRIGNQRVGALIKDRQHRLYIGSVDGLYRCKQDETSATLLWRHPQYVLTLNDMSFDSTGRLWVASRDGALCFDPDGRLVDSLTYRNGLRSPMVYFLTTDHNGILWVGTANGLYRYDPVNRKILSVFNKRDGLFSNSIDNLLTTLPSGEIFVGHMYSFNIFSPDNIPQNTVPPRVVLAGIKVLDKNRDLLPGKLLVLQPGENVVSFDFSTLNFTQPEKTILQYRLIGFNENWVQTLPGTPITYTNLDGGDYVLQVKAFNGDGVESAFPFELRLKVIPPFYQTGWFRLLVSLLVVGLVSFVFWYREQERRRLDRIRRRIARDLHDDMGSTLSSIRFFSEVAQSRISSGNPEETRPLLSRIADSAGTLSDAVRDIVWAIGGKNDRLDDLVTRMREFGLKICEAKDIEFYADLPEELPDRPLRPDQLRNFYLVFKEAVNNAGKYAGCTEITIRLRARHGYLTLEIADNGRGFDPQAALATGGNGLSNMPQRAAEIGGKFSIHSAPGKGTRVVLTAPLR